jgi:hypothetical protein
MTELSEPTKKLIHNIKELLKEIAEEIDRIPQNMEHYGNMPEEELYKALNQFEYELSDYRMYWHYPPEDEVERS